MVKRHIWTICCGLCLVVAISATCIWILNERAATPWALHLRLTPSSARFLALHLGSISLEFHDLIPVFADDPALFRGTLGAGRLRIADYHRVQSSTGKVIWHTTKRSWLPYRTVANWSWRRNIDVTVADDDPATLPAGWRFHRVEYFIPLWMVVLLTALPPGFWIAQQLRRRRRAVAGGCAQCGYDLRATPTRCPECGLAVNPSP